jgi:glycosyltransferase involved in cell wall biosynthesis
MRLNRRLTLAGAQKSRALIVQTQAMKAAVTALKPSFESKVHVIPGGFANYSCEPDCFFAKVPSATTVSGPRLIYFAHPSEHKNHDKLVYAMVEVVRKYPSASLLLTLNSQGSDDARYAKLVRKISATIHKLNLSRKVICVGRLSSEQIACALRHCDLSVFPSLSESFGLPLAESLAAGCPIAASDLPFAHEVAQNAAEYFDPLCEHSIARSMLRVLGSEALRDRLMAAAKPRAQMFAYETIAANICDVIERCTTPGNNARNLEPFEQFL